MRRRISNIGRALLQGLVVFVFIALFLMTVYWAVLAVRLISGLGIDTAILAAGAVLIIAGLGALFYTDR